MNGYKIYDYILSLFVQKAVARNKCKKTICGC